VVLFDWNGTVVDDARRFHAAVCFVLRARRLPEPSLAQTRQRFRLPLWRFFVDLGVSLEDLAAAEETWNQLMHLTPAPLQPGVAALLVDLHRQGVITGVVSAAGQASLLADLERTGTGPGFTVVIGGVDDKACTLRWFTGHGARAAVFYVGDCEEDVRSAQAAGAIAVAYTGGYRPAEDLATAEPDYLVADLADVAAIVAGCGPRRHGVPFRGGAGSSAPTTAAQCV
jgi:phosphoglycolate phosphatase-like HAD superfamily hydrolase